MKLMLLHDTRGESNFFKPVRDLGGLACYIRDFGVGVVEVPFVITELRGRTCGGG
jgi:hypothetical protein